MKRALPFTIACLAATAAIGQRDAVPDVLIMKDGKKIEGEITDAGALYEVKSKYGTLKVEKADVQKILKDPAQMTAEAELCRKFARGMYDDALKIENDSKERNRKLTAGVELLEKALRIYTDTREVFPGSEYQHLDKEYAKVIQELRLYRDKMVTDHAMKPPEPVKPPESATPPPTTQAPPATPTGGGDTSNASKPPAPAAPIPSVLDPIQPPPPVVKDNPASAKSLPPEAVKNVPPPPKTKTPDELRADLASSDPKARRTAVVELGKTREPASLAPLLDAFKKETDASVCAAFGPALAGFDPAPLAKHAVMKDAALQGNEHQKRAVIALFKQAGTDPGVRFLIDHFVAKGDPAMRNHVASALKKHKKIAIRPLIECFARCGRIDIQGDIIKYLGILRDGDLGARFLIPLLEVENIRNVVGHSILKTGRPAVPMLIQVGLCGQSKTRMYSAFLLRYITDQNLAAAKVAEWTNWWNLNRRSVEAEEATLEKKEAAKDYPVLSEEWEIFDRQLPLYYWYYGGYPSSYPSTHSPSGGSSRGSGDK
jgi:hypothetical protein